MQLLGLMEEMSQQYQATLENLRLINSTVSSMLSLVSGMDAAINSQLQWLMEQLGKPGKSESQSHEPWVVLQEELRMV